MFFFTPPLFIILSLVTPQRLEVCLSPGCVADGAQSSLDKLQALAPFTVVEGGCESLCGKGPVVISSNCEDVDQKKIVHKRIAGSSLVQLLEDLEANVPTELVQGYELMENANEAAAAKSFEKAIPLFEEGIRMALEPAKAHGGSLTWLGRALRSLATCQLATFQKEAALQAIQQATDLDPSDAESWDVQAQVCEALKDSQGECNALQAYFALPTADELERTVANRRRTLGFRLQKLERELTK
mmetsp:Transcript_2892/g.4671  ORF Transcript_2892/g.4671 Transcript_2892/m.4671 type:complete len:243 (+) Transcript_2892:41-769(+)|eukprot:CAMPEP_0119020464 /NCGR_PEP_ID=MMETSP1176-20130426/24099_1 /TAXON_ID=265551 /ORGANISM="Synedropsis recta cf, Strain CCMP1620" /LENGTH=242 /DNA_ID=CAMNT_0006974895 /DNA_START=29 /DNA_END=757 /DNA_ORIENTATION=+